MGSKLVTIAFVTSLLLPLGAKANEPAYTNDQITIKKIRTHDEVKEQYCYVQTGGSDKECETPGFMTKLDVIYVPQGFGDRILNHLKSAYRDGYYKNISKLDLFHGHFLAKGPNTEYASAADWFNDVEMTLYHSAEYLHDVWKDLEPGEEIYKEHATERSFAGWVKGENLEAEAAINLVLPSVFLKSYPKAGTIYAEELNESLQVSSHQLSTFGGNKAWHMTNSCAPNEKNCKPCEIFNMMYIMPDPNGRFITSDGAQVEIFFHCKFKEI